MELQVGRWGNSLALRLPAQLARDLGVQEGSVVAAEAVGPGQLKLAGAPSFDRKAYLAKLAAMRARMPVTEPVVEQMRREARA